MQHWLRSSIMLLCVAVSGCAWFIPPEKNAPRYNTVIGELRRPEGNYTAPTPTVAVPSAPVVNVAPIESQPLPPPVYEPVARHVPVENPSYPSLTTVPTVSNAEQDAERLARVREQLERDRAAVAYEKSQVRQEAIAESTTRAPLPAPTPVVPRPAMIEPLPTPSVSVPMGNVSVAPPRYVPPPVVSTPAPSVALPQPMPAPVYAPSIPAQEPIVLRAPQPAPSASYMRGNASTANPAAQPMQQPSAGGFDPMAGGNYPIGRYTNSYLPPSRYFQERGY